MPLYVRSEHVNAKADQLAALLGKSKSKAVSAALDAAIEQARRSSAPTTGLQKLQAEVQLFLSAD